MENLKEQLFDYVDKQHEREGRAIPLVKEIYSSIDFDRIESFIESGDEFDLELYRCDKNFKGVNIELIRMVYECGEYEFKIHIRTRIYSVKIDGGHFNPFTDKPSVYSTANLLFKHLLSIGTDNGIHRS